MVQQVVRRNRDDEIVTVIGRGRSKHPAAWSTAIGAAATAATTTAFASAKATTAASGTLARGTEPKALTQTHVEHHLAGSAAVIAR